MRAMTMVSVLAGALLVPAAAGAEYTRIELKILGMDCAICAHGIRVAVQKVDGVESVELSLERAQADIRLRPGNKVSLDQFRAIVKGNGFEPKQAIVTAVGTVRAVSGAMVFDVSGVARALTIAAERSDAAALKQLKAALDAKSSAPLEIAGSVELKPGGVEQVAVTSVKAGR